MSSQNRNRPRLTLDNPDLMMIEKIILRLKLVGPYIAFAFIGTILIAATYGIFFFFKDLYITWNRKDDRGYFYKFVDLKPHVKLMTCFTVIISIFWIAVLFLEYKNFILISGFLIFSFIYIIMNIKHYLIDDHDFDYFDDLIWFYHKLKKTELQKLKKD